VVHPIYNSQHVIKSTGRCEGGPPGPCGCGQNGVEAQGSDLGRPENGDEFLTASNQLTLSPRR